MVLETSTIFTMSHGLGIAGGTSKYVTIMSSSKYVVVTCYNININYQSSLPHVENVVPFDLIMCADKSKIQYPVSGRSRGTLWSFGVQIYWLRYGIANR